ncbi:probable ATP-dependent RNA helicase DDX28 [Episyrphus balteatus]|uniref:probable ATP-dependent RNA helicase DDX28 n=1 Tax=Episyrphus balteatus TaxID=286459 RepID=UPI0024864D48|nr:probable ATP-dependent RNA helicase DDX28 [Episyrphus balteatus]
MLRNISNLTRNPSTRTYAAASPAVKSNKSTKTRKIPLIECKKPELNVPFGKHLIEAKFGTIPLASNGWMHRKSKGDYFIINPSVNEDDILSQMQDIKELKLSEDLIQNLNSELEITQLTKIQSDAIPIISDSEHVLIAAETGCGKTLAYLMPIVQQILEQKYRFVERQLNTPLVLILTPGRELALQIAEVASKLCKSTGINVKCILGGNTKQKMINPEFEEVDILVGSMGAISKLVTTGIYRMDKVRHVVLDEADTLLDDTFSDKLCFFLKRFPFHKNHLQDDKVVGSQLILASATMPTNTDQILQNIIDTSTLHQVVSPNLHRLMPHITHKFLRMNKSDRPANILTLVKSELAKKRPVIVFGNKSSTSDYVSMFLNNNGVNCINLNGDMLMKIRIGRFEQFQQGHVDVLSTTDVGSRGLDTTRARQVVNFDFPLHVSDYIHRCGRIGRVGSQHKCLVTNFVSSQREISLVQKIEHAARTGSVLPNVNANISNLIQSRIVREMKKLGVDEPAF